MSLFEEATRKGFHNTPSENFPIANSFRDLSYAVTPLVTQASVENCHSTGRFAL